MNNTSIAARSYLYFFVFFSGAGLQNIVPQLFFSHQYPDDYDVLLSICLMSGAIASLITMVWSPADPAAGLPALTVVPAVALVGVLFISLFFWQKALPFIIAFVILRALIHFVYNRTDHAFVYATPRRLKPVHSRLATLYHLAGIMAGPLYFTTLANYQVWNVTLLGVAVLLLGLVVLKYQGRPGVTAGGTAAPAPAPLAGRAPKAVEPPAPGGQTNTQKILLILYILAVTIGVQIYSNNAILIVRDYYGQSNAAVKGGVVLAALNASGIAMVYFYPRLQQQLAKRRGGAKSGEGIHAKCAFLFLGCAALLKWPLHFSYSYLITLNVFTGFVYGLYWLEVRRQTALITSASSKNWVLTFLNYSDSIAILSASFVLLLAALAARQWDVTYLASITTALVLCFALAGVMAWNYDGKLSFKFGGKQTSDRSA